MACSIPGVTVSYDSNGNLTADGSHTYTWDSEGRPHSIDSTALVYDALGRMVERGASGSYVQMVYDPTGNKLALMAGQTFAEARVALPGGAKAVYASSGLATYWHPDWLGSSRLETTPSRTVSVDAAFAPYGETYIQSGQFDRTFTGYSYSDTMSDLYDFMFREHSPVQGRWISPDPAGLAAVNPANPQTWNRYAYVGNNPLSNTDPLGLIMRCPPNCAPPPRQPSVGESDPFAYKNNDMVLGQARCANDAQWPCRNREKPAKNCTPGTKSCFNVPANNGKPPCKNNTTYSIPQQWQNAALSNYGWTVASVTLNSNGDITGLQIANLTPLNFQGVQLPGNSRMTVQTAPEGFTLDISGSPGYLGLPTGSWYSAGVNYAQFSNGQFTNVNGQAATIPGSSLLGSLLGINSQIQNTLNNTPDAISGANALSGALANCTF